MSEKNNLELASFAAGCFWGVQAHFDRLAGVISTEVGYMGGHTKNPTYRQVCTGQTGHAETLQITFNPEIISYEKLVQEFFELHDPTQLNRQGPDVGTQYRSVVFYHSPNQQLTARNVKESLATNYSQPIVTEISPAEFFWSAEEYHQNYLQKNTGAFC